MCLVEEMKIETYMEYIKALKKANRIIDHCELEKCANQKGKQMCKPCDKELQDLINEIITYETEVLTTSE